MTVGVQVEKNTSLLDWSNLWGEITTPSSAPDVNARLYFHRYVSLDGPEDPVNISASWQLYARGYWRAAEFLLNCLISPSQGWTIRKMAQEPSILVYPIVFCFRQSLELIIKSLLLETGRLLDEPEVTRKEHSLTKLWASLRQMIADLWGEGPELRQIETLIETISRLDPDSERFRYPVRKDGALPERETDYVNLSALSQAFSEVFPMLEGASEWTYEQVQHKYEALWEAQQEELNAFPPEGDY